MNRRLLSCTIWLIALLVPVLANPGFAADWDELQKFIASDRAQQARFGVSVSMDGEYAIVGAYLENMDAGGGNMLYAAGAAYIFIRQGSVWVQQQKLVAADRHSQACFGYSVSISGSCAIVGALYEPYNSVNRDSVFRAGAAYIFERSGTTWTQVRKVVAPDRGENDYFGESVGISAGSAIVGAYKQDKNASGGSSMFDAGAAYMCVRRDTGWALQQKITAAVRQYGAGFGFAVAISGNRAVVGAMDEDPGGLSEAGAAYIFRLDNSTWVQEERLVAADTAASSEFGWSVSMSGDDAAIGAYRAHYDGPEPFVNLAGCVYVFVRSDTDWIQQQQVFSNYRTSAAGFGYGVSISGDNLIGGCVTWRAHVFARSGGIWTEVRQLVAHDSLVTDDFGNAVAISGVYAMVGAQNNWLDPNGENSLSQAGAVYVFGPGSSGVGDYSDAGIPGRFDLQQNYPNPFNPSTTVRYALPQASRVDMSLFNVLGQRVALLVEAEMPAGYHEVRLEGSSLASGVYFCHLRAGPFVATRKMLLMR
jgi:hypothetical protein